MNGTRTSAKDLTVRGFRAWLEAGSPGRRVGYAAQSGECPLPRYLGPGWVVDGTVAEFLEDPDAVPEPGRPRVVVELPPWAQRFVDVLDDDLGEDAPVRAGRALLVLEEAERYSSGARRARL